MGGTPQPLLNNMSLVNENGTPTDYFVRWAQQRQIDIQQGITEAEAQALIDAWAAGRQIIAGSGLDGGGPLSSDVTLTADVQEILDQLSTTHGDVIYRDSASWSVLAAGTAGQVLQTNGAGADPSWVTPAAGGGGWTLISTVNISGTPTQVDFTSLGSYTDIMVLCDSVTSSVSGFRQLLVSTNGGSSYYSTTSDYRAIQGSGAQNTAAAMMTHTTSGSIARSFSGIIFGINDTGVPKVAISTISNGTWFIADNANPINALRINNSAGGTLNAGTIHLLGR
jgi:hypothetical protein